ncbi:MAG: hypothetical protein FWD57_13970 [Polyangiaceae bacterium]|nr:hypothetical protein [Polyangiaceae bacterium]
MTNLRNSIHKPRPTSRNPAYPRLLPAGLAIALAACGGQADPNPDGTGTDGTNISDGNQPADSGSGSPVSCESSDSCDAAADSPFAGGPNNPYDAGDEEVDTMPPYAGLPEQPFDEEDAGDDADAEDGEPPWDPGLAGDILPPFSPG